jgi:hypothetical protein
VVVGGGTAPAHGGAGGGSLELHRPTALKHNFHQGVLLWHRGDVANSLCSPWDGSEQWWRLVTVVSPL